jgi:hypothetical protein
MRAAPFGGGWTHLGILVREAAVSFGDVREAVLPDGVDSVRLALWSVTSSLTVWVACFEWDDYWTDALDRIARTDYSTAIIPTRTGHRSYDPFLLKRLEATRARRNMRRRVASWLTDRLPGAFADLGAQLPALDVITSARSRPFEQDPPLEPIRLP